MNRVLLVGWGAIGDTVHAIPAITAIRKRLGPGGEIWFESILARREGVAPHVTVASDILGELGLVDHVGHRRVSAGRMGIAAIEAMVLKAMLTGRFDRVLVLMPFAAPPALLALLGRFDRRFCLLADGASDSASSDARPLCWHLVEALRRNGIADGEGDASTAPFLHPPAAAVREAEAWLARNRRHPDRRLVSIAPHASYPANRWPTERFVELVRALEARGSFEILLSAGENGEALCREIAAHCPGTLVSAGELSIFGTAAIFQRSAVMIGLDTGTTHLASATGSRFVAIYGQRGTGRWYFPPCPTGIVLQRDVPCRGCWLTHCDRHGHPCLTGIGVGEVLDAVLNVC